MFRIVYVPLAVTVICLLAFTSITPAQILGFLLSVYVLFAAIKWIFARRDFGKTKEFCEPSPLAQDYGILKKAMAHRKTFKNYSRQKIKKAFAQTKVLRGKTGEVAKSILAKKRALLESDLFRIVAIAVEIVIMLRLIFTSISLAQIFGFIVTAFLIFKTLRWRAKYGSKRK